MIAKTTTGSDFEGALTYGAGQRQGRKQGQVELLITSNVREGTPQRMAQEMQLVANESKRIEKAVWHTSLSWPPGENISREQKLAAAERYCELMGAPYERHQVVVYEHHDKAHEHLHIYLNRVPVDGGPALRTSNNFYKQPGFCKQICQELGMRELPQRRRGVKDIDPTKYAAREQVRAAIQLLLGQAQGRGRNWFASELAKRKIDVHFNDDAKGVLRGVSFETGGVALTGQEVGYKGAQLRNAFTAAAQQQTLPTPPITLPKPEAKQKPKKRGPRL